MATAAEKDAIAASLSDIPVQMTSGPTEEQMSKVDWSSRESMVTLLPAYMQEAFAQQKAGKKTLSKAVNIEYFQLKTPFGDRTLIDDSSLIIEAGKRQCLYGQNSTGKTLLFSNMSAGTIKGWPKHINVHHCKELEPHELHDTVLGTVVNSHPLRNALLACEKRIKEVMDTESDEDKKDKMQENLDYIEFTLNSIRSQDAEDRAKKMLRVLGFDDVGMARPCSALSGGLRMRVALCVAFFIEADLLLLDEPTNHLDFPSVLWLENRLRGYRGSFLLVSHDRELLNNTTTAVVLIEDQKMTYFAMGFKDFEKKKAIDDKKKYDDIEKFLSKNTNYDPSTMMGRQVHDKKLWSQRYYEKQVALAGKFTFPPPSELKVEPGPDGKVPAMEDVVLIDLKDLRFSYNPNVENPVFIFSDPIAFRVTTSTRVGVMGPNGAGKSTLLKLLTHKLTPTAGTVTHHPDFVLAYFGQHSTAELDLEKTPMEFMQEQFPDENPALLRTYLSKTGVVGTLADTRMKRLSFSQRSCVIFSKLTWRCPHLLIMDEPTNFLDLESVDSLISACNKYRGALLLVSHNRDFLRKCAKQYLSVVPGQFLLFDELKRAEQATYSFIAEMEEGGNVKAGAASSLQTSGAALGAFGGKKAEEKNEQPAVTKDKDGAIVFGASSAAPKPKPAAKPAAAAPAAAYAVNEKVKALWKDGKYYNAQIKKVEAGNKYAVLYLDYGNTVVLPASNIQKLAAAPAAKAAPAKK